MTTENMKKNKLPESLNFLAPTLVEDLIRLGRDGDGGYVVQKAAVMKTKYLISLGICDDWSFEESFKRQIPGLPIDAYDFSVSTKTFANGIIKNIQKLITGRSSLKEVSRSIRILASYKRFFNGNTRHFKERVHDTKTKKNDVTIEEIIQRAPSQNIFLKMDIEGSEYRVIDEILKHSTSITGLAIEFHDTIPYRVMFVDAITKLLDKFTIVHIHGNNYGRCGADGLPDVLEISFSNKSICQEKEKRNHLPINGLDHPNSPKKPDYPLIFSQ